MTADQLYNQAVDVLTEIAYAEHLDEEERHEMLSSLQGAIEYLMAAVDMGEEAIPDKLRHLYRNMEA